jgi:hypothetical protein
LTVRIARTGPALGTIARLGEGSGRQGKHDREGDRRNSEVYFQCKTPCGSRRSTASALGRSHTLIMFKPIASLDFPVSAAAARASRTLKGCVAAETASTNRRQCRGRRRSAAPSVRRVDRGRSRTQRLLGVACCVGRCRRLKIRSDGDAGNMHPTSSAFTPRAALQLEARGIPTARGGRWAATQIRDIVLRKPAAHL